MSQLAPGSDDASSDDEGPGSGAGSESGLSRESWPSLQDTLASTEYSSELYVRRENKRLGWRMCNGRIISRSIPNEEAWLQIDGSDGYSRRAWRLNELMIDVQGKRTGLRVTQQSTTGGRPIYRLLLRKTSQEENSAFEIGFFGAENNALEKRDLWLRQLLLAGATPEFSVDLTAQLLAPLLYENSSVVASILKTTQSSDSSNAQEESKQHKNSIQDDIRLSCANIEEKRLASALAALSRGMNSSRERTQTSDISGNKKSLKQYIYMATEAALGIAPGGQGSELRRSATECLVVAARTVPILIASLAPLLCLIQEYNAHALLQLLKSSVRARRAVLDADKSLSRAVMNTLTNRLHEQHIADVLGLLIHECSNDTAIFPDALFNAVPGLLVVSPEENSVAALAAALAQLAPKRWAAALSDPNAVRSVVTSLKAARQNLPTTARLRRHLISALALASCNGFIVTSPQEDTDSVNDRDNKDKDEMLQNLVARDDKKDKMLQSLFAAVAKEEQRFFVNGIFPEEKEIVQDIKNTDETESYCKIFNSGGQSGLGLELTAGPWRNGVVAPAVHRTNNATHKRGVAFKDELIEINGRFVEYELRRSSGHAEVRAAMIAACNTVRDAPWPKRLTFVRRKPPDNNPHWRQWLAAKSVEEKENKLVNDIDIFDRARHTLATFKDSLVDALCDPRDEMWTRLYACRLLATLASVIRFPSPIFVFVVEEFHRSAHIFSNAQDEEESSVENEDMAMLPMAAYAALLDDKSDFQYLISTEPPTLDDSAMSTDEITGRLARLVARLDPLDKDNGQASSTYVQDEEWWHDPKALYEEYSCTIESPPLACTMALRGQDSNNLACRVESVIDKGRADVAGIRVNDILVIANDLAPPRKAETDTALVDFFKALEYPINLHFVRRVCVEQVKENEDDALVEDTSSESLEDDISAAVDHEGALGVCLSSLLYSSRAGVAALAARALELAARSPNGRIAAHACVMAVKQVSAIAMTPALVQRVSSWTPPANEAPEGLTRDEAAQLVPLAETEFSDAVPLADFAAPRVLQAVVPPRQQLSIEEDEVIVPGSILARLLDAATGDGDDDDEQRDVLRATALDALAALCGAHDQQKDEYSNQLRKQVASACAVEPEAIKGILKLIGGARGAGVAASAVRFLLAASTMIRSAAAAFVYAGAFHSLAWLVRVDEIPSTSNYRRKSMSELKYTFPSEKSDPCWWWLPKKFIRKLPKSVDGCRELALDALVVLLDACREVSLGFSVLDESTEEDTESSSQKYSTTVVRAVTACLISCGNILKTPTLKHERQRAIRAIGVAALAIRDALSESVLKAISSKTLEENESAVCAIVVVLVATDSRLWSAAASDDAVNALLYSIATNVGDTRLLACQGLERLCAGSQTARDALANHSDALQTALVQSTGKDLASFESLLRACASSSTAGAVLAQTAASHLAGALARNDAAALMIADATTEPSLWEAVSKRTDALAALWFVLANCSCLHTLNDAADCLANYLSLSKEITTNTEIPPASIALKRLLSSTATSAACCRALTSLAQRAALESNQSTVRQSVCRALASQDCGCREAATLMCASMAPDEGDVLSALAVRLLSNETSQAPASSVRIAAMIDDSAGRASPLALIVTQLDMHRDRPELTLDEIQVLSLLLESPACRCCALAALVSIGIDIEPRLRTAILTILSAPEEDDLLSALGIQSAACIVSRITSIDAELMHALVTALERFVRPISVTALCHAVFELSPHFNQVSSGIVMRCVESLVDRIIDAESAVLAAAAASALASLALAVQVEHEPLIRAALSPAANTYEIAPLLLFVLRRLGCKEIDTFQSSVSSSSTAFYQLLGRSQQLLVDDIIGKEEDIDFNAIPAIKQEEHFHEAVDEEQIVQSEEEKQTSTAEADESLPMEDEKVEEDVAEESSGSEALVEAVVELEEPPEEEDVDEAQVVRGEDAVSEDLDSDLQAALELSAAEQRESSLDEEAQLRVALELSVRESELEQERRAREPAAAIAQADEEKGVEQSEEKQEDEKDTPPTTEYKVTDEDPVADILGENIDEEAAPIYEESVSESIRPEYKESPNLESIPDEEQQHEEPANEIPVPENKEIEDVDLPPPPAYDDIFQNEALQPTVPRVVEESVVTPTPRTKPPTPSKTNEIRLF